jgi:hypothetical protein
MGLLTILPTVFIRLLLSTEREWEDGSNESRDVLDLIKHSARNDLHEIRDSAPVLHVPVHYRNVSG